MLTPAYLRALKSVYSCIIKVRAKGSREVTTLTPSVPDNQRTVWRSGALPE